MDVFRPMSTPREGNFAAVATELAATQHHAFVVRAKRAVAAAGAPADPILEELARRLADKPPSLASWTPEVGVLATGFGATDEAGRRWLQAQAAVGGVVTGALPQLELETTVERPLLVCGQRVAPGPMRLRAQGEDLEIVRGADVQRFHLRDGTWLAAAAAEAGTVPAIVPTGAAPLRLVGDAWHAQCDMTVEAIPLDAHSTPAIAARLGEALDLLGEVVPEYRAWVLCLLKEVTPIRRPAANALASGSSALRPGGVDIAFPATATETAEMLIHECSHQYLHMVSWFGALITKDAKPHYSPLKNCERPLDRIVLGYHAYGNVMLAYTQLGARGHAEGIASRARVVANYLDELVKPLVDEVGLTALGREIVRPLRHRLSAQ